MEPTQEDIEFLNRIDQGFVGIEKPKVLHSEDLGMSYLERCKEDPEEDHMRLDEQGYE